MDGFAPDPKYSDHVVPFEAGDGMPLNLIHVTRREPPTRGPVLVVHGAGVRANLFRPPVATSFVDALLDHGYDVWLENWRASIDLPANPWSLDQAALYDHPQAVATVQRETGCDAIKAVVHCQGSTSFMMSVVAGLVPAVTTVISNSVSLHPVIPEVTRIKFRVGLLVLQHAIGYLDPQWGVHSAPGLTAKLITAYVRATHHECDNLVCRLASFTYGVGSPTMWSHANLNPETHAWITQEFAKVPTSFFEQMLRCVEAGHLVAVENLPGLPKEFGVTPPLSDARIVLVAGEDNRCFLPESQRRTFDYFDAHRPGYHKLITVPHYGHLDVFFGKHAARDIFGLLLAELN